MGTPSPGVPRWTAVEIKDIVLPDNMQRAMAKEAEAERERRAKIVAAEGEYQAAGRPNSALSTAAADFETGVSRLHDLVNDASVIKLAAGRPPRAKRGTPRPTPLGAASHDGQEILRELQQLIAAKAPPRR